MATSPYAAASADKLDEIIRLAEARLNAQLTLGVAADQRGMTFASFLAAIDAALIAALATAQGASGSRVPLILLAAGFGLAALLAVWSAQPVAWDIPGYRPGLWIEDIAEGDSLHNGKCAMAGHYEEAIRDNDLVMKNNANVLRGALLVVMLSLVISGFYAVVG